MTKEIFKRNVQQACKSIWPLNNEELDFVTEMLHDPKKGDWTYDDFYELAKEIGDQDGDVFYTLMQFDAMPNLQSKENHRLMMNWFIEHKQAFRDCLVYIKKGGEK